MELLDGLLFKLCSLVARELSLLFPFYRRRRFVCNIIQDHVYTLEFAEAFIHPTDKIERQVRVSCSHCIRRIHGTESDRLSTFQGQRQRDDWELPNVRRQSRIG